MKRKKQISIGICIVIFLLLAGGYLALDWFQAATGLVNHKQPEIPYVRITKVISSIICFLLVLLIQKDGVTPGDTRRLFIAYLSIFIAEILLLFDLNYLGTAFFALANILLIIRHLYGFGQYHKRVGLKQNILQGALAAVILLTVYLVILIFILLPVSGLDLFFIIIIIYGLLISISVWSAFTAIRIGFLPRANAFMAFLGLLFLFIGDMATGYKFISSPALLRSIATFIVWIFYAPSLLLIALSGYDFKRLFTVKNT